MRGLSRLAALLEAFLFVKGDPVTMEELVSTLGENPDEIEKALALLKERYGKDDSGITLHETGAGWSLATKKEYDAWLTEMLGKQTPLSGAALETLAVIAMKEPVTRAEIEKIAAFRQGAYWRRFLKRAGGRTGAAGGAGTAYFVRNDQTVSEMHGTVECE